MQITEAYLQSEEFSNLNKIREIENKLIIMVTHNPELAKKGNMRDYTDLLHLVILNNLENTNAEFIKLGISQSERLVLV